MQIFTTHKMAREKGLKGFLLMESLNDQNEVINLTFWKTKEDYDAYYSQDKTYAAILEKTVSLSDGAVEMTDYTLANFRVG
ncbi:MAG: antibiotic biosynthesis monooxygenase [Nitrososphaeraceae archaeon]